MKREFTHEQAYQMINVTKLEGGFYEGVLKFNGCEYKAMETSKEAVINWLMNVVLYDRYSNVSKVK